MSAERGRMLLFWLGLTVSAVFAYFAVRRVHADEAWEALRTTNYAWLAPSLALMTAAFYVRVLRWQSLFAPARRPPFRPTARALFVGYLFNNILPARAGEIARIAALRRATGASLAETAGTIVVERILDVLSLLVLLFAMSPWLPSVSWLRAAAILALAVGCGLAVGVAVLAACGDRPLRFLLRPLERLPFVPTGSLEPASGSFVRGLEGLLRPRRGLEAFVLTTVSWILMGVAFWLVTLSFSLDRSPLAGLLVVIAVGLAMILPSSPAAVGVFEGATVVALGAYGTPETQALSYALVLHAINVLPFLVLGLPLLVRPRRRRRDADLEQHGPPLAGDEQALPRRVVGDAVGGGVGGHADA